MKFKKPSPRSQASRRNGSRSKGPVTPAGKAKSSINALRHGMLAKCVVLADECPRTFNILLHQFIAKFHPADDIEHSALEEMAAACWRLRRIWTIETGLFNRANRITNEKVFDRRMAGGFTNLAAGPELALLDRSESRLHRIYRRAFDTFTRLKDWPSSEVVVKELPIEPKPDLTPAPPTTSTPEPLPVSSPEHPGISWDFEPLTILKATRTPVRRRRKPRRPPFAVRNAAGNRFKGCSASHFPSPRTCTTERAPQVCLQTWGTTTLFANRLLYSQLARLHYQLANS